MGENSVPKQSSDPTLAGSVTKTCCPDVAQEKAIICEAICACQGKGNQMCVDNMLAKSRIANGGVYHDPYHPNINVQVPFDMSPPPSALMSNSQTSEFHQDQNGNPRPLPKPYPGYWMFSRPKGTTRVPDIVITHDPTLPPTGSNVKRVVEIKFDDDWLPGQREAYGEIDPTGDPLLLSPEACGCKAKEQPEPVTVPVAVPAPAPKDSLKWYDYAVVAGILIVAGVIIFDPVPGDEAALPALGGALAKYGLQFAH